LGQERAILMKKKRRKKKVLTVSDFKIDNLYIYKKSYIVQITSIENDVLCGKLLVDRDETWAPNTRREIWRGMDYSRYKPIKKSDLVLYTNWINKYSGFWKLIGE